MDLVTADFLFFSGILTFIVSAVIFLSHLKSGNKAMLYLSITFGFIALHGVSLSLPILIDKNNSDLIQVFLILASGFFFLALLSGIEVLTFLRGYRTSKDLQRNSSIILVLLGVYSVIVLYLKEPHIAIVGKSDIIMWNFPQTVAIIMAVTCIAYGIFWAYICFHAAQLIKNRGQKIKIYILALDGVLFGLSGLFGYISYNPTLQISSTIIFFIASIISVMTFLLPQKIFNTAQ